MGLEAVHKNLLPVFKAIDDCIEKHRTLPALILIYATIDIVASLQRQEGEGTRSSFVRWAESYLTPAAELDCSGIDLYAARCGILHTLTTEADLVHKGEAKRVVYAWGTAAAPKLQEASRLLGYDQVVVHVAILRDSLRGAVARFLEDLERHPHLRVEAERAASLWFDDLEPQLIDLFLGRTSEGPTA